jgi:hypothetical protein
MKALSVKLLLIIVILYITVGCKKNYVLSKSQDILFQYEFIKTTGTYTHRGILVDAGGNIFTYNMPDKWNFHNNDQVITSPELLKNLSYCTPTGKKIPPVELRKLVNCIDNISASKVSSPRKTNSESGNSYYYCYQFSEKSSTYNRTVIKTEGNLKSENLNFYSKKIILWMDKLRKTYAI